MLINSVLIAAGFAICSFVSAGSAASRAVRPPLLMQFETSVSIRYGSVADLSRRAVLPGRPGRLQARHAVSPWTVPAGLCASPLHDGASL